MYHRRIKEQEEDEAMEAVDSPSTSAWTDQNQEVDQVVAEVFSIF